MFSINACSGTLREIHTLTEGKTGILLWNMSSFRKVLYSLGLCSLHIISLLSPSQHCNSSGNWSALSLCLSPRRHLDVAVLGWALGAGFSSSFCTGVVM